MTPSESDLEWPAEDALGKVQGPLAYRLDEAGGRGGGTVVNPIRHVGGLGRVASIYESSGRGRSRVPRTWLDTSLRTKVDQDTLLGTMVDWGTLLRSKVDRDTLLGTMVDWDTLLGAMVD